MQHIFVMLCYEQLTYKWHTIYTITRENLKHNKKKDAHPEKETYIFTLNIYSYDIYNYINMEKKDSKKTKD